MNPQEPQEPQRARSSPAMAKLITVAVLAMGGYSQVTTGHVGTELTAAMVALVALWLGVGADRFLGS